MKKRFILIFVVIQLSIFFSKNCLTQTGWYQIQSGVNTDFYSLYFTSPSTGYVVGNQYILKTTNSGASWNIQVNNSYYRFRSIIFIDQYTGIVIGRDGLIMKTTNAGFNWVSKNSGNVNDLLELFMYDNNNGFISGGFETFLRTTDCGESWSGYTLSEPYHLYSVYFPSTNSGWCVGGGGRIFKSTNFGLNWALQNSPTNLELHEVFFRDQLYGMAIGLYGISLKTSNGGLNWNIQNWGVTNHVYHMFFTNNDNGWVVGDTVILHTTDFGETWVEQQSDYPAVYVQPFFTNNMIGYIAGWGSTILKTTTGGNPIGIKPISSEIPSHFSLYQNYPNPFNPVTKIKFSIPSPSPSKMERGLGGKVKLILYNILGSEVATLVNEKLSPGTYDVEWDAGNCPSGVYFYRIITENYNKTNKMILLK
ncbi:MAG: YCF48-related protein [Ignavibacteria bacterium]